MLHLSQPVRISQLYLLTAGILTLTLALAAAAGPVQAETFWDKPTVLKAFFANSERVTFARINPTMAQAEALRVKLGYAAPAQWTVYYGLTKDHVDGVAVIDDELGQHQPITFAALLSPQGALQRLELMVYREAYGSDVKDARFRNQFKGKTVADPVRHGADIVAVAGATISSKALAVGARRALVMTDELLVKPGVAKVLQPGGPQAGGASGARAASQR